jgi:hypothetical protein
MQQRISWEVLPDGTRSAIEAQTGTIREIRAVSTGMNSALAAVVCTDRERVFVKGIRNDNPGVVAQQREAEINPYVRSVAPELLWHLPDVDGWNVLGFEHVDGRVADYRPGSADLPLVLDTLRALGQETCPDLPGVKDAGKRWASYLDDPADAELFAGNALLHTDYNPDNLLIAGGWAYLIDWAWPTRGAAWIDPCCLLIRMIAAGHTAPDAEAWASKTPAWHTAPLGALDIFARACVRMWQSIADHDPQPWKQRMAEAAREWADVRMSPAEAT